MCEHCEGLPLRSITLADSPSSPLPLPVHRLLLLNLPNLPNPSRSHRHQRRGPLKVELLVVATPEPLLPREQAVGRLPILQ